MQELIERLERATGRSVSLNVAIALSHAGGRDQDAGPQPIPEWMAPDGSSHVLPLDKARATLSASDQGETR